MESKENTTIRVILGCIGCVIGFLVIYYAFEEVSIPNVTQGRERPLFYTGLAISLISAAFVFLARKR